jgi:L-rhamnose mutarotase
MKRFGMAIRLKPGSEDAYRAHHAAAWPEVLDKIQECNLRNYSIYLKDNLLFTYFEYHGSDIQADWAKIEPLQDPLSTRKDGEWWADMEEVFHLD